MDQNQDVADQPTVVPSLTALFLAFFRLGATSLGGGLTNWIMHDFVRRRRWLGEEEFLSGLAIAQALPGINVVNLPIWIGWRLHGWIGALVCAMAVLIPGIAIVAAVAAVFASLSAYPATHRFLSGAIAVAIGLSIAMGLQAGKRVMRERDPVPWVLMGVCFVLAGPLHAPAAPVIVGLGGFGILYFLWRNRNA